VAILDANPEVFNRLHKDFERMQERKKDLVEHYEESLCAQQDSRRCREQQGLVCHDKAAFERLLRTREKGEPESKPVPAKPQVRDNPTHRCCDLYHQHRERAKATEKERLDAAENAAKEAAAIKKRNQRAPNFEHLQRLHNTHAKMQDKLREQRDQAAAAETGACTTPRRASGPARSETFQRLYMERMKRDDQIAQKRAQADREEEAKLKDMSVHRRVVGDNGVFERLFPSRIEEPELQAEEELASVWRPPPMVKFPSAADVTQQVFAELGLSFDIDSDGQDEEYDDQSAASFVDSCATTDAGSECGGVPMAGLGSRRASWASSQCSTAASSRCGGPPKRSCMAKPSGTTVSPAKLRARPPVHLQRA
jgi:hypothetical protein